MTNGYLLTAVMLWFFDSIAIFILLAKAINKYKSVMKPVEMANSSLSPSTSKTKYCLYKKNFNLFDHYKRYSVKMNS